MSIEALHDGGADFCEKLIQHLGQLRAFARTLTGQAEKADELCQEALVKAWQGRATFEPGTNLKAWLFAILRNRFFTERRRAWRERPLNEDEAERTLVIGGSQEAARALSDVAHAMRLLPDDQREALILVGAGGFTYEEAAGISDCVVGTMKSRVSRARRALESLMSGNFKRADRRGPSSGGDEILAQLDRLSSAKRTIVSASELV
jgi:RNA polymerase sigma-70 factor (ECF subfamily)